MMYRQFGVIIAIACVTGCGTEATRSPPPVEVLKTVADPLTPANVDQFLEVVRELPGGLAPEFTPLDDESDIDQSLPGKKHVEEFRARFRKLCDPRRQGSIWSRDEEWMKVLSRHNLSAAQFAALMGTVSCAITRVRLQNRFDVDHLVIRAQARVDELVASMDRVDRVPRAEVTREMAFERAQAAFRLRRAVALLEFAELVRRVPPESQAIVRQYGPQLKPLLAASEKKDPFAELQTWDARSEVQPAGYEAPAQSPRNPDR